MCIKKLAIGVGVAVVLIGLLPWGLGVWIKHLYHEELTATSKQMPETVKLEEKSYQKGWLRSMAVTELLLFNESLEIMQDPDKKSTALGFVLKSNIQHGPILTDAKRVGLAHASTTVHFNEAWKPEILKVVGDKPVVTIDSSFAWNGDRQANIYSDPISWTMEENAQQWKIEPLQADYSINRDMDHLKGKVSWAGMEVKHADKVAMKISDTVSQGDYHWTKKDTWVGRGFWLGQQEGTIALMQIPDEEESVAVIMNQLAVKTTSDLNGELLNGTLDGNIQSMQVGQENYGPINLVIAVNGVDAAALSEFQAGLDELQKNSKSTAPVLSKLPKLLGKGLLLDISKFYVKTPEGDVNAKARLKINAVDPKVIEQNMFALLKAITFDADIAVPEVSLNKKMSADMVQQFVKQGFIKIEQGVARSVIHYSAGEFTINGTKQQVPMLSSAE